ncbi:MAG TPA: BglII/BstYI family type II restriction endonuclease [Ktedonobacterales bacterium]|nr:BglII/BstYI family type II restriction endonuclease [Ktedonobacterales bacterium]
MRIVAAYSFNNGQQLIERDFVAELDEIKAAIAGVDAAAARNKESKERDRMGRILYKPGDLNRAFLQEQLYRQGWLHPRVAYKVGGQAMGYEHSGYIEADGIKNQLGLEVQFGKYAFLGWDILGKMPILASKGYIRAGVEVVPMKSLVGDMSSGIGHFEQIVGILELRGVTSKDIPVLILGIAPDLTETGQTLVLSLEDAKNEDMIDVQ